MFLKDLFKAFTKTGKTVHKSVKGTLKFMDDVLEKEYIVGTIDDIKEATGKVVEKSGEMYENAKHSLEGVSEDLQDKYSDMKEDIEEKYAEIKEDMKDIMAEEE